MTSDRNWRNNQAASCKFSDLFSYLLFLPVLSLAAELKGVIFSPSVHVNQTEAFSASATTAAPSLCYSNSKENHSIILSARNRATLNFFILSWSLASLFCQELLRSPVKSPFGPASITREPWSERLYSVSATWRTSAKCEVRTIPVKNLIFVSPSSESAVLVLIAQLFLHEVNPSHFP